MESLATYKEQEQNSVRTNFGKKQYEFNKDTLVAVFEKRTLQERLNEVIAVATSSTSDFQTSSHLLGVINEATNFNPLYNYIYNSKSLLLPVAYSDLKTHIKSLVNRDDSINFDYELPNDLVVQYSIELLNILYSNGIIPQKISSSFEGSIMWEFLHNEKYFLIELHNDGDVVYLRREKDIRFVLDLSFEELKTRVIQLLNE